ncbi:FAD/NAD(P)-binding domain-containing protein [Durotheca rogersii]|uniref:FAD/NAD(P)-binding domain-containing protein n=1 Tax=Durotheca rogersii TaxID=419775 RepID=UPI0022205F90|nr:FAD/NAD(P)-binding domain-containing protein [Durotheca rogersii]KAI5861145.1 FAD/NAD(P)-binding domain-containing protein [Durotheca rogersii]
MGDAIVTTAKPPQIAIVGGGIVGIILALGLTRQNIPVRVYEQARGFREVGAGIAFSACARRCMELINPAVVDALRRCGAVSISDDDDSDDYLRWIDGYNQHLKDDPTYQKPLSQISGGGFRGCRRDQFLEELEIDVPPGTIEFGKRLEGLEQAKDGRVILSFADGTRAEADAVIGCDGVKSRVRQHLFGTDHEASHPQYTHKIAYRGLVPMDRAIDVLGDWKAHNFHHHVGPGAHLTHYPVANHKFLNVVVFLSDPNPWPDYNNMVAEGTREEIEIALRGWHRTVLDLVKLLPDKMITWALFDLGEFPVPRYNTRNICLAGDAAHASSPHHGAGACAGVEDALCLTALLGQVCATPPPDGDYVRALGAAFETFDAVRRSRTQWLVNSSRRVCDLYHQSEWADPRRWIKAETCFEEIRDRSYKIWQFDADDMVQRTLADFERRLAKESNGGVTVH